MHFVDFIEIALKVVEKLPIEKIKNSTIMKKEKTKFRNHDDLKIHSIIKCYLQIFPHYYKNSSAFINEYFLDWSTRTDEPDDDVIIVKDHLNNYYCFKFNEVVNIFHIDLSRSNADLEFHYNICSVQKSFRLPHNPYSNLVFSVEEVKQILSQILLIKDKNLNFKKYPDVCWFLYNYQEVMKECKGLSSYYATDALNKFFEQKGLFYKEKTKIISRNVCENYSEWINRSDHVIDFYHLVFFS